MLKIIQFFIVLLLALYLAGEVDAAFSFNLTEEWNQWRGPSRDGQVTGRAWPDRLTDNSLEQRWRVSLGPSYSGPIVSAQAVFVTETKDKSTDVVGALARATGNVLWRVHFTRQVQCQQQRDEELNDLKQG